MPPRTNSNSDQNQGNVRVCCRVRPQNNLELSRSGKICVAVRNNVLEVESNDGKYKFTYDRAFDTDTRQEEVFEYAGLPIVKDVLEGYNGTIFAYGQTSSGKTYTMEGPSIDDEALRGIIPRTVKALFEGVMVADENIEFTVKVSYIEIYMEKIRDLLDPYQTKINLPIREDPVHGIYVGGVTEEYVTNDAELLAVMKMGAKNRAVAATGMNEGSSRSHSVFTITVTQRNLETESMRTGKFVLVDLAGSEMVRKTGATGQQLEEAKTINKSLSALGQVINALTDPTTQHVPYRDSKLTRVLQDSLGGNSKTTLIVNVSPSSFNAPETISTLRFGNRAKNIKNKAVVNEEKSVAELKELLARAEHAIDMQHSYILALEAQMAKMKVGGTVNLESDQETQPEAQTLPSAPVPSLSATPPVPPDATPAIALPPTVAPPVSVSAIGVSDKEGSSAAPARPRGGSMNPQDDGSMNPATAKIITSLQERLAALEQALLDEKEETQRLGEENKSLTSLLYSREAEIREKEETSRNIEVEISGLKIAQEEEKEQLNVKYQELSELRLHLSTLQEENSKLQSELEASALKSNVMATEQASQWEGQIKSLRMDHERTKEELKSLSALVAAKEEEIAAQRLELKKTEESLRNSADLVASVTATLKEKEEVLAELQTKSSAIEKSLNAELESLASTHAKVLQEYKQVQARVATLEEEKKLQQEISNKPSSPKKSNELASSEAAIDALTLQFAQSEASWLASKAEFIANQRILEETLAEQKAAHEHKLSELLQSIERKDAALRSRTDDIASKQAAWAQEKRELSLARAEAEDEHRSQLEKALAKAREVEIQHSQLMMDFTTKNERVIELELEVEKQREKLASVEAAISAAGPGGMSSRERQHLRDVQQRLEQLVAVHRQLLRKYASLELEAAESKKKLTLRDERIKQLEHNTRLLAGSMKSQAERHVTELTRLRDQISKLREEQQQQQVVSGERRSVRGGGANMKVIRGGGGSGYGSNPPVVPRRGSERGGPSDGTSLSGYGNLGEIGGYPRQIFEISNGTTRATPQAPNSTASGLSQQDQANQPLGGFISRLFSRT